MEIRPLEPCGLGGVLPDDHFMVVVSTKRVCKREAPSTKHVNTDAVTDCIVRRLATMSTSSPAQLLPTTSQCPGNVEIEYVSGRIKRLAPVPLPPPAIFFPPFSTDCSSDGDSEAGFDGDDDKLDSSQCTSRKANPHQSDGYSDGVDLSSGDEDGEDPNDEPDARRMYDVDQVSHGGRNPHGFARRSMGSAQAAPGTIRGRSKSIASEMMAQAGGSSAATTGGVGSGYRSSAEVST